MIAKLLLEKLRCPFSGASLFVAGEFLVSTDALTRYRYTIKDGIPIMLIDSAEILGEREWKDLMNKNHGK
ncbi:MAG: hypothetical protein IPP71_05090 [Bacteroidetes bacterium]|nr:hypothetical protein [Bacteroidota bacterium]